MDTKMVKTSKHIRFDEVMNDIEIPKPNGRNMDIALVRPLPEYQEEVPLIIPPTLEYKHTPLSMIHDVPVRVLYDPDTLGVFVCSFPDRDRVYIEDIIHRTYCSKIKDWENKLRGTYIVQIQNTRIVTLSDDEE